MIKLTGGFIAISRFCTINSAFTQHNDVNVMRSPYVFPEMKEGGTQLKLIVTFADEGQALFKPMR